MGADSGIWLGVLGPLHLRRDGVVVPVTANRQRAVLGTLLVRANEIVSFDELADVVWAGSPPPSARATVRNYVRRLRRLLGPGFADRIMTRDPGYLFQADDTELDRLAFARLCADGHAAIRAGEWQRASDVLGEALGLWRGPALVDVSAEALRRDEVPRLDRMRLRAVEWRVEAELCLGRHEMVADELRPLLAEHPLHERLHAHLMLALARSGRRAEALEAYRRARQVIVDELGVEPGKDLSDMHERILRADPDLHRQPAADGAPGRPDGPPVGVPRQLPAPVRHFTGRAEQLDILSGLLGREAGDPSTVVISAVDGMAGVGKTALAVHAAHRLAARYPDGQVFLDLHGHTEGIPPTEPGTALEALLRSIGVDGAGVPRDVQERTALWRTKLADRRVLVVLDNASDEAQVAPLLPASSGCLVLVTSRRRLAGLDDAEPVSLDVLPESEAVALFTATAGPRRLAGTRPGVVEEIVDLCGRLPLAIRIAAARLRHRSGWTPDHLLTLLRGEHGPLTALRAGPRSVTAALHLSYQHLTADQRRLYRRLGLHPGPDVEPYAAAALSDSNADTARRLLDDLHDAHLLTEPVPGRYQFHDLVRAHAATTATEDPDPDRQAALDRLFDHYAHTATVAMDLAYPFDTDRRPAIPPSATPVPGLDSSAAAEGWLDAERDNLLAAAVSAAGDRPHHTGHQSATLHRHLCARTGYTDAATLHTHALTGSRAAGDRAGQLGALSGLGDVHRLQGRDERAAECFGLALEIARETGDRTGELNAVNGLGYVHSLQGRHERAAECFGLALEIARETGDRTGELNALRGLGDVHRLRGGHGPAADCFSRALEIARETGNRTGELNALNGLSYVHWLRGEYERAADCFGQVLEIARDTGSRLGELNALTGLGHVHRLRARYERAADCYGRALGIARGTGNRTGELNALNGLSYVHWLRGQYERAADCFGQVLGIARDTGNRNYQFEAQQGLGRVHHATGRYDQARTCHHIALDLATDFDQPADQARAHDGLAHTHLALGDPEIARRHWRAALDVLTAVHTDHTEEPGVTTAAIRAHLAELDRLEDTTA
ncbi:MAG TPA: tetratricopeptide repeat protein [Mycobacteriales bacterium]|nr:tetratricopeptide repeat protein [Mycobacteriales bacterium]